MLTLRQSLRILSTVLALALWAPVHAGPTAEPAPSGQETAVWRCPPMC